jgi:RNA polymerase sigma factor (sigma-70 family)
MNNLSESDALLIEATIKGDQEAFQKFVEKYQKRIFSYLYRFLYQNKETAEDITQTVFLKVYQNLNNIDQTKAIKSWIYRIAHNEAANYLRSVSRKKESMLNDEQWSNLSTQKEEEEDISEQYGEIIQTALKKIKPKYREVIVLYYFEEKSYDEISIILNSSTSSVGTLIRRAKQQLKKILEKISPELAAIFIVLMSFWLSKRGRLL